MKITKEGFRETKRFIDSFSDGSSRYMVHPITVATRNLAIVEG